MRNKLAHMLLSVFVVTLAVSNVLLAQKLILAKEQIPALAIKLASLRTPIPTSSPIILSQILPETSVATNRIKIRSLKPTSGPVGAKVTINGSGFTSKNNTVNFAYSKISNLTSNGATIKFVVPSSLVYPCIVGQPCPTSTYSPTTPGAYTLSVTNSRGTSNKVIFTVK